MALLTVNHLNVAYGFQSNSFLAVKDVSFSLQANEFLGIVGESGCGKSTLGSAMMRLLRYPGHIVGGDISFSGKNLGTLSEKEMRELRWKEFSIVMQSGMNALNPVLSIYEQFADTFLAHTAMKKAQIEKRTEELLKMVNIDSSFSERYPHELSGGMKQRVAIALALALNPKLVLMDEPTTALDVVVQRSIIQTLKELRAQKSFAVIFISHDLGTVLELADRVAVMYAGQFVEIQHASSLLQHPVHPYSAALLDCFADPRQQSIEIKGIPGSPPNMKKPLKGCPFAPRCQYAFAECFQTNPKLIKFRNGYVACHKFAKSFGGMEK
ncbi:MAG: ABC transporter ATP-binding protein [Sporolactobacillus sp.]|jgi:oligopeptide/dipeptide ABC transporter ATP-binding protein|nr:ABC transporter ATP-binding protein [Sporolactobacillus sp.]